MPSKSYRNPNSLGETIRRDINLVTTTWITGFMTAGAIAFGIYTISPKQKPPTEVIIADINHDNRDDVIVRCGDDRIYEFIQQDNGKYIGRER